jgi:hypothetical protein
MMTENMADEQGVGHVLAGSDSIPADRGVCAIICNL